MSDQQPLGRAVLSLTVFVVGMALPYWAWLVFDWMGFEHAVMIYLWMIILSIFLTRDPKPRRE